MKGELSVSESRVDYPDHLTRSEDEQQSHDQVIELLALRLQEQGIADVRTNPGGSRENAIQIEDQGEIYPDVFTVEEEQITAICEVETASTVNEGSVPQWKEYASLGPSFLLIVPLEEAEVAQQLIESNEIPCQNILTYQVTPADEEANGSQTTS
jgi:hypothetical protein